MVKLDAALAKLWSKSYGAPGQEHTVQAMALAPDGHTYLAGRYENGLALGSGAPSGKGIFVAKPKP